MVIANTEVYDFIFKIDRRIGYLEKDLSFIEQKINTIDYLKKKTYIELINQMNAAKLNSEEIRSELKKISVHLMMLSQEMKDIVKLGQADNISKKIDEIPFNDFITRTNIKRGEL